MKKLFRKGVGFLLCFAFALGCSSVESYSLEHLKVEKPLTLKVAILPVELPKPKPAKVEEFWVVPDEEKFQQSYVQLFQRYPIFREVKAYREVSRPILRAWQDKVDLLLKIQVEHYKLSYLGVETWRYLLSLALWGYFWFPSWWVADEWYEGDLKVKVRLVSVHSGREYPPEDKKDLYTFRVKKAFLLDDWQRGWKFLGIFTVPSYLSESNWESVRETLAPYVEKKLQAEIWKQLARDFYTFCQSPGYMKWSRKVLGLAVGI